MKPIALIVLGIALLISGAALHLSSEKISEVYVQDGGGQTISIQSRKNTALYFGDKITFIGTGILFIGIFASINRTKQGD
jgi:uncharacterized membrane protein